MMDESVLAAHDYVFDVFAKVEQGQVLQPARS